MLTQEQKSWLKSLVCQRLSAEAINDTLRLDFKNERVESLMNFIGKEDTLDRDQSGEIAVYVIKENGRIIAYFSLQCGMIYERIISQIDLEIYELFKNSRNKSEKDERLVLYQAANELSDSDLRQRMEEIESRIRDVAPKKNDDRRFEETMDVMLVNKTIPAIEIIHLCKTEDYWGDFDKYFPDMKLGVVLFLSIIVGLLRDIRNLIGCHYVYLFAVTDERDNKLVAHYQNYFGFSANPGYGVNKSLNASGCLFMAQKLEELFERAKEFDIRNE